MANSNKQFLFISSLRVYRHCIGFMAVLGVLGGFWAGFAFCFWAGFAPGPCPCPYPLPPAPLFLSAAPCPLPPAPCPCPLPPAPCPAFLRCPLPPAPRPLPLPLPPAPCPLPPAQPSCPLPGLALPLGHTMSIYLLSLIEIVKGLGANNVFRGRPTFTSWNQPKNIKAKGSFTFCFDVFGLVPRGEGLADLQNEIDHPSKRWRPWCP